MKILILALALLVGCGVDQPTSPDAGEPDAQADVSVDAAPDAPEVFQPCAEVCPDEELSPWYVNGSYVWSYCLPSYKRCDDPSQH